MERNTKNMVAAQQSQFFMSKYEASKMFSSFQISKFNVSKLSGKPVVSSPTHMLPDGSVSPTNEAVRRSDALLQRN